MRVSWKSGASLGSAYGIAFQWGLLTICGVAALWGISEATGFRTEGGDFNTNDWARATIICAFAALIHIICGVYTNLKDNDLINKVKHDMLSFELRNNLDWRILAFFSGFAYGARHPTVSIRTVCCEPKEEQTGFSLVINESSDQSYASFPLTYNY